MSDAKIQRGDENNRSKNVFLDTKFSFYGGEFCVTQSYLTLFFLYVYRGRQRRRSKSASRVRHYSPAGRNRSRYLVREYFSDESSSAESEDDIIYRRRSQSNLVSLIKIRCITMIHVTAWMGKVLILLKLKIAKLILLWKNS